MPLHTARRSYAHAPRLPDAEVYDLRELFAKHKGGQAVLELELGCARGGFLLERLAVDSTICIVGLEIQLKAVTQAEQKVNQGGYSSRCRVFASDARVLLPRIVEHSVRRVFVHFPDPWWKKRHSKRRLASYEVMNQLARILQQGGELYIQTDVQHLAQAFVEAIELTGLAPVPGGPWLPDNPFAARSPRERQAVIDGLPIFRLHYQKP